MTGRGELPYGIVVPARDEETTIERVLAAVRPMTDDLLLVDGHSTDRTVEIARSYEARIVRDNGLGKGGAVRVGLDHVKHPITVFVDART